MSRKVEDLTPEMQVKFKEFAAKMAEVGLPFILTSTYRSQEEQNALYEIGRSKPGRKVTWTLHSRHTQRDAFDIAVIKEGKPTWDTKVSVNENDIPDYFEAGKIGQEVGLIWGGTFKNSKGDPLPDFPHFQNKKEA